MSLPPTLTVVRVQLRLEQIIEQQPSPGVLAALLDALREMDARFADAIEAALLDAKAQQLTVLRETLRAPLSAVDEALLHAWEQLWEMALSSGQQREALQEEMRRDAEQRKRDEAVAAKAAAAAATAAAHEEAAAAAAAAAREAVAAAAQRAADAKLEQSDAAGDFSRAEAGMEQLEAQLICEKQAAAELRSQLLRVTASAAAEAAELRAQLEAVQEDSAAAQGSNELESQRALVRSLREEVARQRSMRLGGMDGDAQSAEFILNSAQQADALQMQVDSLAAQLARQEQVAEEARQVLAFAWQEERDTLLSQLEALTLRLSSLPGEAEGGFAGRLAQCREALRDASGDGAAFDAVDRAHAAQAAATAERHGFELSELRASSEAAAAHFSHSIAHASRAVLAHARKALAEAAPAESAATTEGAAAAAAAGEGESTAMAVVADGAVAAMQATCMDCVSAAVQIAQEMARRAQLAHALCGLSSAAPASEIDVLPLPQLAKAHAAQLDELVDVLRLAQRPCSPPAGPDMIDPDSVAFKEMAVEIVRQGQRLSTAAAAATHAQRREASSLQSVRRQLRAHALPERATEVLHGMAARHQQELERAEVRREQLWAARAAMLERGMQAFTTIVHHGTMFGGAREPSYPHATRRHTSSVLSYSTLPNAAPAHTTRQNCARYLTPRPWKSLLHSLPKEQHVTRRSALALCRHDQCRLLHRTSSRPSTCCRVSARACRLRQLHQLRRSPRTLSSPAR